MKTLEIIDGDTLVVRDEDGAELGRGRRGARSLKLRGDHWDFSNTYRA